MRVADFELDDSLGYSAENDPGAQAVTGSIVGRLVEMARTYPDRTAVADEAGSLTYAELLQRVNRVAHFISALGLPRESPVGVMTGRNSNYLVGIAGVLAAGCAFVPLDPALPLERRRQMVRQADIPLILSDACHVGDLHQLQWRCAGLGDVLCLDSDDIDALSETPGSLMSIELWDHLAGDSADDVLAGGWKSAFTGQPIPAEAMAAFGANARDKTAAFLKPDSRVLEVGCASGFTMRHVAPSTGRYVATDLSRRNVERTESFAIQNGMSHVSAHQLAAHDIDAFEPGSFELIILNSVVENFPGFGYLRAVLDKAARLLAPGGTLFLGNIWDADRRDAYLADLAAFARENAGKGYDMTRDFAEDLFVPAGFFADWAAERGGFALQKSAIDAPCFDPAPYTYDLTLTANPAIAPARPAKRRHDRRALPLGDTAPDVAIDPGDLAYVLFTSGTTGTPKGVMVEHGSVVNLAYSVAETQLALLRSGKAALHLTCVAPFAFDGSIVQLFAALLNGHAVHLPEVDTRADPVALDAFLRAHAIDQLDATPSLFSLLLDHWERAGSACPARMVVLGGEVVTSDLPERFFAIAGHGEARLVNAYGPTECCVSAAQHVMTAQNYRQILPPPIGRPIPGVTIDICDDRGRRLPAGVPGEIRIGGAGVARGYLDDPALTERRFIAGEDGSRVYRSGDIGRRLRDGDIHFIGREDRQVKIRGNRVELDEVESALLDHHSVRRAIVLPADPAKSGSPVLVAYVVAEESFDPTACKAQIARTLPAYMVPSHLLPVTDIPLTVMGKVDIARLPAPSLDESPGKPARPLASDLERRIARLMGDLLGVPVKDAEADFFALGGHSVLAVQLLFKLNEMAETKLPLSDLFTCSTVKSLAERIEALTQVLDRHNPMIAVNTEGAAVPIVCFHPVGGNVLCYRDLARALGPDQPVHMIEALGLREGETPHTTVEEMVAASLPFIAETLGDQPVTLAGWSFGGLLAYEAAFRLQQAGADVRDLILLDAVAVPDTVKAILRKDEADYLAGMFDELGIIDAETLRPLTPEQRLDLLVERGKASNYLPQDAGRAVMRRLLAVFQNNALAAVRYAPPRLDGLDILLIRPRQESLAAPSVPGDEYSGWRGVASGEVILKWMEGTHGTMLTEPHVREMAGLIADHIGARQFA